MRFFTNFISCSVVLLAAILFKGAKASHNCYDSSATNVVGFDCDEVNVIGSEKPWHTDDPEWDCGKWDCCNWNGDKCVAHPEPTPAPPPPPCPPPTPATTLTQMKSGAGVLGIDMREGEADPWCPCLRVAEELQKETPELTPKITCTTDTFLIVDGAEENCLSVAEELDKGTPKLTPKITCSYVAFFNYSYLTGSSDVACALNCLVGITGGTFEKVVDGALISGECPACAPADISSLAANGHGSGDHPHEEADHPHAHTHWWLIVLIIILFLVVVVLIVRQVRLQYSAEP